MEFRVLGPLEVADGAALVRVDAAKQRTLLGVLLLHANEVVSQERLVDELWGERPPATAAKLVQTYVSQLRRAVGAERIETRAPGYRLRVEEGALDAARFRRLTREARELAASGEHERAERLYREALAIWRGPALADVAFESFARNELDRLEEERVVALSERIDCELALGRHEPLVAELDALVKQYPLRERLRAQLMLALYRSGRQADALAAYQDARHTLVDELGLEPSRELQALEKAILTHDPAITAPPRAARAAPTNLPIPPTPFLGRRRELAEVVALLRREQVRLLTLTGTGGSGKTRLALEAASELAGAYADGVWWVALAALRDPQLVLESVAQTLAAKDDLAREIGSRQLLLLLDNFEHLPEAAPELAQLLAACPNLNALVTSRERLHVAVEHEYVVTPLAEADAIELFYARAEAARPGLSPNGNVAEICRRVDCLPLAVELAAARTKVLPTGEILQRLDERLPLLTGGPRDVPERQRTLRATIEWSYELLDQEEKTLFARLAVFAGGCDLVAAENVCRASLETLQSLVDKSLVNAGEGRFTLLETIREYAADQLAEGDWDELRARHADHFLAIAQAAEAEHRGERQSAALERLESEHGNMRAAFAWSAGVDGDLQLRLAVALAHFWLVRGYLGEGRRCLEEALARAPDEAVSLRIKALGWAANAARLQGEDDQARSRATEALALARARDDKPGIAKSLSYLGVVAIRTGDYERAASLFEQCAEINRELGDTWELALAVSNLGEVARAQRDYERAAAFWGRALADFKELSDVRLTAWALCNLGLIALQQRRSRDALRLLEEGLALARPLRDPEATAYILEGLAAAAEAAGDVERAVRLVGAADSLLEHMGAPLWPSERLLHERTLGAAASRLSEEQAATAWAEGRAMSIDDAIDYAAQTTHQ